MALRNNEGDLLRKFRVYYLGGHPSNTKRVQDTILYVKTNSFAIENKGNKFENIEIAYDKIKKIELSEKKLSGLDVLAAGVASLALKKPIVIQITYVSDNMLDYKVELEMADAITPSGNVTKCKELMDMLRNNRTVDKFIKVDSNAVNHQPPVNNNSLEELSERKNDSSNEIFGQIEKLSELYEAGILNSEEFESKKKQLLKKI